MEEEKCVYENEVYCKHCDSCGESGCCPPTNCKMKEGGKYCEHYLEELKEQYHIAIKLAKTNYKLYEKLVDED